MTVPVPSGLRPEEVARLVEELAPLVVGERLGKVYQLSPTALRLVIGSGSSRRHLLVSTRPGFSRIHLVTDFPEAPAEPSECVLKLRALISGAKITAIRQHRGDRVAKISIEGGGEGPFRREIWIELFGRSGRLLVVEGKTLTVRFLFGRKGITEGERYSPPEKKPSSPLPGEMKMPFDPLALAPQELRGEEAPLNRFLEVSMARAEIVADANDRLVFLKRELTRILSRRNRLNERLGEELESARDWLSWQRRGELLQGNRHLLERGLERVEVVDWFSEGTPIITVSLDSALTPSENVDRYFRKARKARRSIEHLQKRRAAIEEAVSILEPISARIDAVAVPLDLVKEDVEALLDEAQSLLMIHGVTRREKGGGRKGQEAAPGCREIPTLQESRRASDPRRTQRPGERPVEYQGRSR
ncbi:MAG TPA: hypothetical protein EYN00_05160 [Planctomycetes bacterium]|nr:hypothetical protein [Planctomycetota bacterium]